MSRCTRSAVEVVGRSAGAAATSSDYWSECQSVWLPHLSVVQLSAHRPQPPTVAPFRTTPLLPTQPHHNLISNCSSTPLFPLLRFPSLTVYTALSIHSRPTPLLSTPATLVPSFNKHSLLSYSAEQSLPLPYNTHCTLHDTHSAEPRVAVQYGQRLQDWPAAHARLIDGLRGRMRQQCTTHDRPRHITPPAVLAPAHCALSRASSAVAGWYVDARVLCGCCAGCTGTVRSGG